MEERAEGSAEAEPCQNQTAEGALKRKVPLNLRSSSPSSTTLAPDTTLSTQNVPVRKLIPLKSKAASPLNTSTVPCTRGAAVTSVRGKQNSSPPESHSQSPNSSRESPEKNTKSGRTLSPTKQARAAPQGPTAEAPSADRTLNNNQKEYTADTKGTHLQLCPSFFILQPMCLFRHKTTHLLPYMSLTLCFLFSEAQAECEAVCHEACSACETRPEEEGNRAFCCRCRETSEQCLPSAGGATAGDDRQTGRLPHIVTTKTFSDVFN